MVYASQQSPQQSGNITVIFENCTITGNNAGQVSMMQPIMRQGMHASGSVQMNAIAPAGVCRECLGKCKGGGVARCRTVMGALGWGHSTMRGSRCEIRTEGPP